MRRRRQPGVGHPGVSGLPVRRDWRTGTGARTRAFGVKSAPTVANKSRIMEAREAAGSETIRQRFSAGWDFGEAQLDDRSAIKRVSEYY